VPIEDINPAPTTSGFSKGIIVGGLVGLIIWAMIVSIFVHVM
jgi:hypothetical protein